MALSSTQSLILSKLIKLPEKSGNLVLKGKLHHRSDYLALRQLNPIYKIELEPYSKFMKYLYIQLNNKDIRTEAFQTFSSVFLL